MKILSLMNKKTKGSITVFMTFIFVIIFGLVLALFENTRIISSTGYIKNAAYSAEESLFGDYNKELFLDYGLFGYGGYNGITSDDMSQEFREILKKNIAVKPQNAKLSYTDIYKIKDLNTQLQKCEGFADEDNFYNQIKNFIISNAIDDMTDKLKNKYSEKNSYDKKKVCEKLADGDDYETGKYKEKYGDGDEYKEKHENTDKENVFSDKTCLNTDSNEERSNNNIKNNINNNNSEVGNPLEVFKELVQEGYLSLVCDTFQLSEEKIEKADLSESSDDDKSFEKYESAGKYLKKMFQKAEEPYIEPDETGSTGKYKAECMIYADKVFPYYTKSTNKSVDYGMEYLICGNEKEKDNLLGVVNRIMASRMLVNFAIISADKATSAKALATATAIAGVTGIEPVIKGLQYIILAILAFEESCIDTAALLDNRKLPIVKKVSDIKIKYEEICMVSGVFFQNKAKQYEKSDKKIMPNYIDYREYLLCFVMLVPLEKIKMRMFDVIQCDLRKRYNESFRIYDCVVSADYNIQYRMKFVFPFLWNTYGQKFKFKRFERQVDVSYRYG